MKYRQYQLESRDAHATAWIRTPRKLYPGARVQVKGDSDPERWWIVMSGGETELEKAPDKGWKVGGLA